MEPISLLISIDLIVFSAGWAFNTFMESHKKSKIEKSALKKHYSFFDHIDEEKNS